MSKTTKINNFFWFKCLNIDDQKWSTFITFKKMGTKKVEKINGNFRNGKT